MSERNARLVNQFDVVVPTIGRANLRTLLERLATLEGRRPQRLVVVDDRRAPTDDLSLPPLAGLDTVVVRTGGRGPAAARNAGWRRCASPWIAFLDDDVIPSTTWFDDLAEDLTAATPSEAAVQGGVRVPAPATRPTDSERQVQALESAAWITADMAVRRSALVAVGGFDERFRRAYREDTDLALRLLDHGWRIASGRRQVEHPVRLGTWRTSIAAQRGNADDALMRRLHGPGWRAAGRAPAGDLRRHQRTVLLLGAAIACLAAGRRGLAAAGAAGVAVRITHLWVRRARPGPLDPRELARLLSSSAVIPVAAVWWAMRGTWRARRLAPNGTHDRWGGRPLRLVLFDRDGTLVHDVPYNADPSRVTTVDDAAEAVRRLRRAGIAVGLITNQSGVERGLMSVADVDAVNAKVAELIGGFDVVEVCPHAPTTACDCRKPSPMMVIRAASRLGVSTDQCAVIGDIGADVEAGLAAGARAVMVPTPATRHGEVVNAPEVASSLEAAIDALLAHLPLTRVQLRGG